MSDASSVSCCGRMPLLVDFNFNKITAEDVKRNGTIDAYRVNMTTQLVVFILFALAAGFSVYAFNKLFDLNSSFSGQMGGIACGLALPFLALAARDSYSLHACDRLNGNHHKIATALIAIAALAVIIGGAASGTFSSEWKGLILGGAVGAISAKLAYDRKEKIRLERGSLDQIPLREVSTEFLVETAKKTALFVFIIGLMIAALYANAKMFGSHPDFASQWKGMIAGGTVALMGAGLYHLAKLYYKGENVSNLTENPRHRFMFAIAAIAVVCFIILHCTGAFNLQDAFHQWPGVVLAGLLTLPAIKLAHFVRELAPIKAIDSDEEQRLAQARAFNTENFGKTY